jgi:hypothetical protein
MKIFEYYRCVLIALTFSLYTFALGLPLSRIPQHSQNKSEVGK